MPSLDVFGSDCINPARWQEEKSALAQAGKEARTRELWAAARQGRAAIVGGKRHNLGKNKRKKRRGLQGEKLGGPGAAAGQRRLIKMAIKAWWARCCSPGCLKLRKKSKKKEGREAERCHEPT